MTIFLKHQKKFLLELLNAKVDFILIGGYAVIFHGYVRTTGDIKTGRTLKNCKRSIS
jgi:hypothetical protein